MRNSGSSGTLAKEIRLARVERGFNQKTLAKLIDVKQQDISRWESAEATPVEEELRKLAVALQTPGLLNRKVDKHCRTCICGM